MYEPIITLYEKAFRELEQRKEDAVFAAIAEFEVQVNKDELIRALKYDRDQYNKGFADGVKEGGPKWISVEERLPEHRVNVLCKYIDECNEDAFTIGWFSTGHHSWMLECSFDESACGRMEVTHWMPLPEPPKEETE